MKRGTVLFRWFVSYLAILVIPLVFSGAVYTYSLRIINQSSQEIYQASLEQFRIEVDNYLGGVFQTLRQLAFNTDIQILTLVKKRLEPREQWNMIQAIRELQHVRLIYPQIGDVFVVLNNLDSVITSSGYMQADLFCDLYYGNGAADREAFKALMKEPRRNEVRLVRETLFALQSSAENFLGDSSATLAIAWEKKNFDRRFLKMYEGSGARLFIINRDNQLVFGSGTSMELPDFSAAEVAQRTFAPAELLMDGVPCRVLSLDSRVMNWRYLYLIPESLEKAKARQIQVFTFLGLFICAFLGLFLSYWLTKRHYDPVQKLMVLFNRPERIGRGEDEFSWIEKKARDTQQALGNNLRILRNYYISALLEEPFDPVGGKRELERYGIKLPGEWNMVALFAFPGFPAPGRALLETEGDIIKTLRYMTGRIFTEAAGDRFTVEVAGVGEYAAALINWSGDRDAVIPGMEEIIEYTQQETEAFLHSPVFTALGESRRGPEGIYYSYLEARETLRYLDLKTGQTILHYRDIRNSAGRYRFTQETEQKFINLIRTGDAEAAIALLRQIWAENLNPLSLTGGMWRLLAYNILGSLIKGAEQGGETLPETLPRDFSLENIPPGELADTLEKITRNICRTNSLVRQNRREHQLSDRVKQYIDENFKNPDINVSITSLHFNMNPAYLSGAFKEDTGKSLLEYLNTLRVEEGKRLLESGCEVGEAAERSGFRGSGAFIRVFKKLAGLTPGQYRDLCQGSTG